jgi:hypothetical protein
MFNAPFVEYTVKVGKVWKEHRDKLDAYRGLFAGVLAAHLPLLLSLLLVAGGLAFVETRFLLAVPVAIATAAAAASARQYKVAAASWGTVLVFLLAIHLFAALGRPGYEFLTVVLGSLVGLAFAFVGFHHGAVWLARAADARRSLQGVTAPAPPDDEIYGLLIRYGEFFLPTVDLLKRVRRKLRLASLAKAGEWVAKIAVAALMAWPAAKGLMDLWGVEALYKVLGVPLHPASYSITFMGLLTAELSLVRAFSNRSRVSREKAAGHGVSLADWRRGQIPEFLHPEQIRDLARSAAVDFLGGMFLVVLDFALNVAFICFEAGTAWYLPQTFIPAAIVASVIPLSAAGLGWWEARRHCWSVTVDYAIAATERQLAALVRQSATQEPSAERAAPEQPAEHISPRAGRDGAERGNTTGGEPADTGDRGEPAATARAAARQGASEQGSACDEAGDPAEIRSLLDLVELGFVAHGGTRPGGNGNGRPPGQTA